MSEVKRYRRYVKFRYHVVYEDSRPDWHYPVAGFHDLSDAKIFTDFMNRFFERQQRYKQNTPYYIIDMGSGMEVEQIVYQPTGNRFVVNGIEAWTWTDRYPSLLHGEKNP